MQERQFLPFALQTREGSLSIAPFFLEHALPDGGGTNVDISGWVHTDERVDAMDDVALDTSELVFGEDTVIGPGEYLVVPPGLGPNQHPFSLGAMGDRVTLLDPTSPPTIVDHTSYADGQAALSWCRLPNGPGGTFQVCMPTMGTAN